MSPKSEIYTPKRDDERLRPFHMGVPRELGVTLNGGAYKRQFGSRQNTPPPRKTWDSLSFLAFAGPSLTGLKGLKQDEFGHFFWYHL